MYLVPEHAAGFTRIHRFTGTGYAYLMYYYVSVSAIGIEFSWASKPLHFTIVITVATASAHTLSIAQAMRVPLFVPALHYVAYTAAAALLTGTLWQGLRAEWLTALESDAAGNETLFPLPAVPQRHQDFRSCRASHTS